MQRRILHVIGAMNRGGVETWLLHVLRAIDRTRFRFHFLVHTDKAAAYDDEIRSLGAPIIPCCETRNPIKYRQRFKRILDQYGPFDVVHSHVYLYSGFVMRLAAEAGVPIRIAHSHTALTDKPSSMARLSYERLMRYWIARYSTHRIGISRVSAERLFGKQAIGSAEVLYYGLDFTRFLQRQQPEELKGRLGIPLHRKVIGHVGRFVPVKNHVFMIEVFQQALNSGLDVHLLLVGEGPLLDTVRQDVESRGISDRCTFAGVQNDVAPFLSAMDVFLFPSLYEGLGIVALEAQAAGVPVIASAAIPEEIDVVPNLVQHIPLDEGAAVWASRVIEKLGNRNVGQGEEAVLMQSSAFALPVCIERLSRIYLGEGVKNLAA